MARNSEGVFTEVFAENGDKAAPPFAIDDGFTPNYSQPITSGGAAPERTTINYLYNQLYAQGVDVNIYGGALPWDNVIQFEIGAVVSGSDGQVYQALTQNTGNDPVSDGGVNWILLPSLDHLALTTGASEIGSSTGDTVEQRLQALEVYVPKVMVRTTNASSPPSYIDAVNVASIDKIATGQFRVNFTNALTKAKNVVLAFCDSYPVTINTDWSDPTYFPTVNNITLFLRIANTDTAVDAEFSLEIKSLT